MSSAARLVRAAGDAEDRGDALLGLDGDAVGLLLGRERRREQGAREDAEGESHEGAPIGDDDKLAHLSTA
jgi:hypothetical protein